VALWLVRALGTTGPLKLDATMTALRKIDVDDSQYGNSYQDLSLSLFGWRLGKQIKSGAFRNNSEVADWIRANLMEPDEPAGPGDYPTPPTGSAPA
jgi:hypothetical protein